jgi:hypothetical protein
MNAKWKEIAPSEARAHHLYGVKNWLAVFAFGVLAGSLRDFGLLNYEAAKAGMSLGALLSVDHPASVFLRIALGVDATVVIAIYWLLLTKHPTFRVVASSLLLGWFPALAVLGFLNSFDGVAEAIATSLVPWAVYCAVWVTYLNRSRRVRVTFEHMVKTEEAIPAGDAHGASMSSTAEAVARSVPVPPAPTPSCSRAVAPPGATRRAAVATSTPPPMGLPSSSMTELSQHQMDEDLYSAAFSELETGNRRPGLWAKCYAATDGVEPAAKAMYLRERVLQMQVSLDEARTAEAAQRAAAALQARETLERIKSAFVKGSQPTAEEVRQLVAAADDDPSLARLLERIHGNSLLHWAARHNLTQESQRLLALGADPCAGNGRAQRPHMVAPSEELRDLLFNAAACRGA